jgi:hypothetical protein
MKRFFLTILVKIVSYKQGTAIKSLSKPVAANQRNKPKKREE